MRFFLALFFIFIIHQLSSQELRYEDVNYQGNIRTVQLYPEGSSLETTIESPVISIRQSTPLLLEFDVFARDFENFLVKLIHCNADWTPSRYSDIEILNEFNEFRINDFDYSFDTRAEYVHYWFTVPRVKISGNYLIKVYREGNEDQLILTRRFMVYSNRVTINTQVGQSLTISKQRSNQQIDFKIDYTGLEVRDPFTQIMPVIRQNQRWDNAIVGLKPTMFRQSFSELEYFYLSEETNFQAGNEFRFFDIRTLDFNGQGVAKVKTTEKEITANLYQEKPRAEFAYSEYLDINGQFIINNLDRQNSLSEVNSEYATVNFFLEKEQPLDEEVYVFGALSDWEKSDSNKMSYNSARGGYEGSLYLKQGWYNFIYLTDGDNPYALEGIHFETENQYEILVYFRPIGARGDILLGYENIQHNNRRN
ncbi:MAG: type IX secretion system plug protein domain-containing protein [Bacteroidota bacterium]